MDALSFDDLSKRVGSARSRRRALLTLGGALSGLLTQAPGAPLVSGRKKGKKKKKKGEKCGPVRCSSKQFCCDDARGTCCSKKNASCCNVGPGTGTCCAGPNRCGKPWGNDAAPLECCPPERQFTGTGRMRCCPTGTRSLGTEISSDDGPCCPEEKYCSTAPSGGKCCGDVAPICVNKSTGQCCTEEDRCGTECCGAGRGDCCNGRCCPWGQTCDNGTCKCPPSSTGQCGTSCCQGTFYGCDGNRCKLWCDDHPDGCGG